ncbi:GUN4 domain-containing protein [Prochlorococcus marinus]|uniref:GUN4 domain-containing protein n=1 Tax=Prochlorococcus marinus TaxID=1219 RepID=UPI0022B4B2A9|nr:GUN4 domain-containing protein [Prochlorococcus marinus]
MTVEKPHPNKESIKEYLESFNMASERKRIGSLTGLEERVDDLLSLGSSLMSGFDPGIYDWPSGFILQLIHKNDDSFIKNNLNCDDLCWFKAPSEVGFDYSPLQRYLLNENYEDADRFTSAKLRELAGAKAVKRGYVYFSEVEKIPSIDLSTLDNLWIVYSRGKFGFTVQAKILDSVGGRYDKLWPRIGWKKDGIWTRYPKAFNWSIEAPNGHMPLVNQLRGVRLMDALLNHQALTTKS